MLELSGRQLSEIAAMPEPANAPAPGIGLPDALDSVIADVRAGQPIVRAIRLGEQILDDAIGLARGEISTLIGAPGVGKSLFADSLILAALRCNSGLRAMIFALETDVRTRVARLLCGQSATRGPAGEVTGIPLTPLLRGELRAAGVTRVAETAARLRGEIGSRLSFVSDVYSAAGIARIIENSRPDLLLIDHIGLLQADGESATSAMDSSLHELYATVREVGASALLIAELNKDAIRSGGDGFAAVRGSARIASLSASLWSLSRSDDDIQPTFGAGTALTLKILKARHGVGGVEQAAVLCGGIAHVATHGEIRPIAKRAKAGRKGANS